MLASKAYLPNVDLLSLPRVDLLSLPHIDLLSLPNVDLSPPHIDLLIVI